MPRVLLITPPMVQINAPYPATACLAGELRQHDVETSQADLSIALAERIFSSDGLSQIAECLRAIHRPSTAVGNFLGHEAEYIATIDAVRSFLQGRNPALARRIAPRAFLPEGPLIISGADNS